MKRREFIALIGGGAASLTNSARAQRRPVIAILDPGLPQQFASFFSAMEELGYRDGTTASYIYRSAEGRPEAIKPLASELVSISPDVIVSTGRPAILSLKEATSTIPIVFTAIGDAIAAGAVNNMARPGGNATGLSFLNVELSAKRLEVLAETLPRARHVVMLRDTNTPREWLSETERAGTSLGLHVRAIEVSDPEAFEAAFGAMSASGADALVLLASAMFNAQKRQLVALSARYLIPTMYEHRDFVDGGGLLSYGANLSDLYRRAALYVDKILKGANPGDLPVEQPTKFELVINLRTAKALRLTIPPTLLTRADEVIE
ncbi:MAG TPA: ABC transporter substrate-binding protein [Beijerinckiaceae bacterium]|jgi:putative ABC transport system substrate-binding protein